MSIKNHLLGLLAVATLGFISAGPASAQANLAKFIEGFNGVDVRFEGAANACGLKDKSRYEATLRKAMAGLGLKEDPVAIPKAHLFVFANAFGPARQQCAVFMALRMGTDVSASAVRIDAELTSDLVLIERAKAVAGVFPAAFYVTSLLFVKLAPSTPDAVDEGVVTLVDAFARARQ